MNTPLKDYIVVRSPDEQFEVWSKKQYDSYIAGCVEVGAGPAYGIVTHFNKDDNLLKDEPMTQPPGSAVWVTGEYEKLYARAKSGKRTACYADSHFYGAESNMKPRDICTVGNYPGHLEFAARGIPYGGVYHVRENELKEFVEVCRSLNIQWLDEIPSPGGDGLPPYLEEKINREPVTFFLVNALKYLNHGQRILLIESLRERTIEEAELPTPPK